MAQVFSISCLSTVRQKTVTIGGSVFAVFRSAPLFDVIESDLMYRLSTNAAYEKQRFFII